MKTDIETYSSKPAVKRMLFVAIFGSLILGALVLAFLERQEEKLTVSVGSQPQPDTILSVDPEIPQTESSELSVNAMGSRRIGPPRPNERVFLADDFLDRQQAKRASTPVLKRWFEKEEDKDESEEAEEEREKARAEFAHDAAAFRNLTLSDEKGEIPLDGFEKARDHVRAMLAEQKRLAAKAGKPDGLPVAGLAPGDWSWQGPGNIGGRIRSFVIHPTDPNKMWIGSVSGGIWRTANAGTTWFPVDDFMANLAISTIAIDPVNPNNMYAGTGEGFDNADALRGDGIWKSTNGGTTWNQLATTKVSDPIVCPVGTICAWTYVNRIAISPDGSTLLAATLDGIQRSTDGGATWSPGATSGSFLDVDFNPTNLQFAIAGGRGNAGYTTDGGVNWAAAVFAPGISADSRVELAYAPSNPNIVYASVDQNNGVVYVSNDGGQTFNIVNSSQMLLGEQGQYANIIWVNPQDPNFVLVGGLDIWRSTDGGATFTQISRWQSPANVSPHADHHMIVASPAFNNSTNKIVYFGNDGGLYRTNDVSTVAQTTGWTNLNNGLGITQFYSGAGNYTGALIGGTQDNGNLKASPGNTNGWTDFTGGDGGFVAADPWDADYFYTEYVHLTIQRSTNGGASASFVYCNPVPAQPGGQCVGTGILDAGRGNAFSNFIAPFVLDPNEPNRMLAGGISLWRSNNIKAAGQPTWTAVKDPAAPRPPAPGAPANPTPPISAISIAVPNSDFIVVGHNDGQIYLTQNGTSPVPSWSRIDNGLLPERFATRVAIDETRSPAWIYATFGGFSGDNVYRTEDLGASWVDITGAGITGLPDVPVRSIVVNPANPNRIYVGTEIGIFASDDAGANWQLPQGGPANVSVDELFFNNGVLVAATHGRGMYKVQTPSFATPKCYQPTTTCTCAGEWNCPCTWPSGFRPDSTTDVVISCPTSIGTIAGQGATAKSLRVNSDLRLFTGSGLTITEDFSNYGYTGGNTLNGGGALTARNFYNGGTFSMTGVGVTGDMTLGGTVSVADVLEARGDITADANAIVIAGRINAFGNFWYYSNNPLTLSTDLGFGRDLYNQSRIQGRSLFHLGNGGPSRIYSGPGVLKFQNAGTGVGITLANDKTFEVESFHVSGPLNIGANSMSVTDNTSFTGTGAVLGTGTIFLSPRVGVQSVFTYFNSNFAPTVRLVSGTAVVTGISNLIGGPLVIDPGATLAFNQSSLTVNGNVTVNGRITTTGGSSGSPTFYFNGSTFTNNGEVSNLAGQTFIVGFNTGTTPLSQAIAGNGSWSPTYLDLGTGTVTLNNDITFSGENLRIVSTLNIGANTLTHTGTLLGGQIIGTGAVRMQPSTGAATILGNIGPGVRIVSGTVTAAGTLGGNGPLTVESGATLTLNGNVTAGRDVTIGGTLNRLGSQYLNATGNGTFLNNGSISADVYLGPLSGTTNVLQNLGGTGTWNPNYLGFVSRSTVTLVSDVNYAGTNLLVEGPGVRVNTGAFTFAFPCTTVWQNSGEIVGNIRRTNLAACPGATLTFGNPFTTIRFTSGTPPSEIAVEMSLGSPAGFPTAVQRSYLITPTGGSGYAATLRLRYLDSELNNNNESTLQLWRFDGSNWTSQGATSRNTTDNWVEYTGVTQFSPWAISGLAPTAAAVSIRGRVTAPDGGGIRNARVALTDTNGNIRTASTGSLGYYRFDDVAVGQTVVVSVDSKRHRFANPTRILIVQDNVLDLDFVANQ